MRQTEGAAAVKDDQHQPSLQELVAALKTLQPPEPSSMTKNVQAIAVAAVIGIGAWLLSGLSEVQSTLTRVDTAVSYMSDAVKDVKQQSAEQIRQQNQIRSDVDALKVRVDRLENQ